MKKQLAILASAGLGLLLLVQIGLALRGGAGSMLVVPVRNETVQIIDLGTLGGTASAATGLNAQGLVVGTSTISETETVQAFLWDGR